MTTGLNIHYDVYIERYAGGWTVASDQTYSLQWCFTKIGAKYAARKWENKLNNPSTPYREYIKDMK